MQSTPWRVRRSVQSRALCCESLRFRGPTGRRGDPGVPGAEPGRVSAVPGGAFLGAKHVDRPSVQYVSFAGVSICGALEIVLPNRELYSRNMHARDLAAASTPSPSRRLTVWTQTRPTPCGVRERSSARCRCSPPPRWRWPRLPPSEPRAETIDRLLRETLHSQNLGPLGLHRRQGSGRRSEETKGGEGERQHQGIRAPARIPASC